MNCEPFNQHIIILLCVARGEIACTIQIHINDIATIIHVIMIS